MPPRIRELAPLLDLLDALVAGLGEQLRDVAEVDALALAQGDAVRPQLGIGNGLGQGDGAGDHHRARSGAGQRVEGGDAQARQMGRRRDVREVAGASRGVEMHAPGRQEGVQVGGEVAGRAVVGRDDQRGAIGGAFRGLEQGGEQVGADGRGRVGLDAALAQGGGHRFRQSVLLGYVEERSERHLR